MRLQKSHERDAKKNCHERGAKKNPEHSRQECLEKARKSSKVRKEVLGKNLKKLAKKRRGVGKNVLTCAIGSSLRWWQKKFSSRRGISKAS